MWQLYLIEQCDNIQNIAVSLAVISIFIAFVTLCFFIDENSTKEYRRQAVKKCMKRLISPLVIAFILYAITPSTQKAYRIFAIGSTMEYLKNNDTAKQLPDKALRAIDKYLDELNKEKDKR